MGRTNSPSRFKEWCQNLFIFPLAVCTGISSVWDYNNVYLLFLLCTGQSSSGWDFMYVFCFFCARPVIFCLRFYVCLLFPLYTASHLLSEIIGISSVSFVHAQLSSAWDLYLLFISCTARHLLSKIIMYIFCLFCARPVMFCLRLLCISSVSFVHGQLSSEIIGISSVSFVHGQSSSVWDYR